MDVNAFLEFDRNQCDETSKEDKPIDKKYPAPTDDEPTWRVQVGLTDSFL